MFDYTSFDIQCEDPVVQPARYRLVEGAMHCGHCGVPMIDCICKETPMRERDIQGKVVGYARHRNVICRKLDFGQGWPDVLLLYAGRVLFMEFKREGGHVEPLQAHMHRVLRDAGFEVLVIDSVVEGQAEVDAFVDPKGNSVVSYSDITKELCK